MASATPNLQSLLSANASAPQTGWGRNAAPSWTGRSVRTCARAAVNACGDNATAGEGLTAPTVLSKSPRKKLFKCQISKMAYPNRQVGSPEVGKSRKRPLVFVYDLPPTFNSELLTRRKRGQPVPYEFKEEGKVSMTKWYYAIEFMLHEWLLSSEHRTADPKEADYFYIPIYAETYDQEGEVNSHADIEKQARGIATVQMFVAAQQHLEKQYPHWNRNNGTDHFWLFA